MSGTPCLLTSDNVVVCLTPAGRQRSAVGSTSEAFLQQAIDASPALVPYREFFPAARQIISLGTEVPLAFPGGRTGYLDNLLLTDDGHLIVVEMKLWRNPEAIREVIAQVLEYGLTLSGMLPGELERALWKVTPAQRKLAPGTALLEHAASQFPDLDEHAFGMALEKFMRGGEMLYLVAGDGIHVSVEAIATWINARSGSPFQFGLLELDAYLTADGGRFIVPRLLVKTKEIARHVVEVVVGGAQAGLAQIQISEQLSLANGATRTDRREIKAEHELLTIESLLGRIRRSNEADQAAADYGGALLNRLQELAFDSRPSRTEIAFGLRDEANTNLFHSLLSMADDRVYLQYPYKLMGLEAGQAFRRRANQVASFFDLGVVDDMRKGARMPRFSELAGSGEALADFLLGERQLLRQELGLLDDQLVARHDIQLDGQAYQIRSYPDSRVKVFSGATGQEVTPALPILRDVNIAYGLGVSLEGTTGNTKNTQLLGRHVLEALQSGTRPA